MIGPVTRRRIRDLLAREDAKKDAFGPATIPVHQLPVCVVKVTSSTATSGLYPASVEKYNPGAGTWSDLGAVWAVGVNGEALKNTVRYEGRAVGVKTADGKPIYAVVASGSADSACPSVVPIADGTYTAVVVSDVSCSGSTLTVTKKTLTMTFACGRCTAWNYS